MSSWMHLNFKFLPTYHAACLKVALWIAGILAFYLSDFSWDSGHFWLLYVSCWHFCSPLHRIRLWLVKLKSLQESFALNIAMVRNLGPMIVFSSWNHRSLAHTLWFWTAAYHQLSPKASGKSLITSPEIQAAVLHPSLEYLKDGTSSRYLVDSSFNWNRSVYFLFPGFPFVIFWFCVPCWDSAKLYLSLGLIRCSVSRT